MSYNNPIDPHAWKKENTKELHYFENSITGSEKEKEKRTHLIIKLHDRIAKVNKILKDPERRKFLLKKDTEEQHQRLVDNLQSPMARQYVGRDKYATIPYSPYTLSKFSNKRLDRYIKKLEDRYITPKNPENNKETQSHENSKLTMKNSKNHNGNLRIVINNIGIGLLNIGIGFLKGCSIFFGDETGLKFKSFQSFHKKDPVHTKEIDITNEFKHYRDVKDKTPLKSNTPTTNNNKPYATRSFKDINHSNSIKSEHGDEVTHNNDNPNKSNSNFNNDSNIFGKNRDNHKLTIKNLQKHNEQHPSNTNRNITDEDLGSDQSDTTVITTHGL